MQTPTFFIRISSSNFKFIFSTVFSVSSHYSTGKKLLHIIPAVQFQQETLKFQYCKCTVQFVPVVYVLLVLVDFHHELHH